MILLKYVKFNRSENNFVRTSK